MARQLLGACILWHGLSAAQAAGLRWVSASPHHGCGGAASFDHSDLDAVLRKFVKPAKVQGGVNATLFDYAAVLKSRPTMDKLDAYAAKLADSGTAKTLSCLSREGLLAFWANAYNGLVLRFVIGNAREESGCGGPSAAISALPKSILDVKCRGATQVWDCEVGAIAGRKMSLEQVLDEARKLGDPRIHAAVNCASMSCPSLRAGAYDPSTIDAQLDEQLAAWLDDETKGAAADPASSGLLVSKILKWHAEDFGDASGFLKAHTKKYAKKSSPITGYLAYDWKLNAPPPPPPPTVSIDNSVPNIAVMLQRDEKGC